MTDNQKGVLAMVGSMAFFTFNDTCMKALFDEIPLFQAIFMRGFFTSIFLAILAWRMGALRFDLSKRDWGLTALRTVADTIAAYLFISALVFVPLGNLSAILQALPLTVTLAGALFLGEPIGWRRLTAILVGFGGVLLIVKPGTAGFDVYSLYGLGCVVVVTVRDLAARRLSKQAPSMTVALIGAVGVAVAAGLASLTETWVMPSQVATLQMTGAVFFVGIAYVLSVATMRFGDIGTIAPFRYTSLLWALLLGFLVFGDWPDQWTLIGSAIVVATGIFTLLRERRMARRAHPTIPRTR